MSGRTEDEVRKDILRAEEWIAENIWRIGYEDVEVINNYDCEPPEVSSNRLWYLGEAIKKLGECDICYFVKGWQNYKECNIKHEICQLYGITALEES